MKGENSKAATESKPKVPFQFSNFQSQLKQLKAKRQQQEQSSSSTSQTPVIESARSKENL